MDLYTFENAVDASVATSVGAIDDPDNRRAANGTRERAVRFSRA